ncbi:MAG TPA: TlpA disulfide reductase family protein [Blastocatellia bacterium]|jgi:thiol-disulfide isomerase/thioredoxin|nr:TlpA disulfide reductase family protein [Blastocatellia bacterium]
MKSPRYNLRFCLRLLLCGLSLAVANLALLTLNINAQSAETKPVVADTAEPTLIEGADGVEMDALTDEEYQQRVAPLLQMPNFVGIKQKPSNLSPQARFGFNLRIEAGPRTLSWILDGDEKSGYLLYADLNANGDLSDDAPLRFERKDGQHSVLFNKTARDEKGQQSYPVMLKLVVSESTLPGAALPKLALRSYHWTMRRGVIQVGQQALNFGLLGGIGIYNAVVFDLNNDGRLDWDIHGSKETYRALEKQERHINLGETSYAIEIDRYGRSLRLKPLAEKLPARVFLSANDLATDFSFTDLDGKSHRLSDYRGKVVLLDFWFIGCGPCQAAIPELMELYEQYHSKGLEIIGINCADTKEALQKFLAEKRMNWPQTIEGNSDGPIQKLYQFYAAPTYFLIDRDGKISVRKSGGMNFRAELEKLL